MKINEAWVCFRIQLMLPCFSMLDNANLVVSHIFLVIQQWILMNKDFVSPTYLYCRSHSLLHQPRKESQQWRVQLRWSNPPHVPRMSLMHQPRHPPLVLGRACAVPGTTFVTVPGLSWDPTILPLSSFSPSRSSLSASFCRIMLSKCL